MLCTSCTQTSSHNTLSPLSLRLRCLVGKCKCSFWKTMKERNQTRRQISYLSLIIDDSLGQNSWEHYTFTPDSTAVPHLTHAPNQSFFCVWSGLTKATALSRNNIELGEGGSNVPTFFPDKYAWKCILNSKWDILSSCFDGPLSVSPISYSYMKGKIVSYKSENRKNGKG